MVVAKRTIKNQLTLPKAVVEQAGMADYYDVVCDNGRIVLTPLHPGGAAAGSCQERCHLLEAFYASLTKATWRLVCWVANGSLIHTKSGCFQQRIDLLQRFGFAMRASS